MNEQIAAIIPAAGFSSRMGSLKPLLQLGETTVLLRLVALYRTAGIKNIYVITGHRSAEVSAQIASSSVQTIHNLDYDQGMFSSLLRGISALKPSIEAAFIHPVDIPLVREKTVLQLLSTYQSTQSPLIYPVFRQQRGHPPLIQRALLDKALDWDGQGGLRNYLEHSEHMSVETRVCDQGILLDMDTPEDYERILDRFANLDLPSREECRFLQDCYGTAPAVREHCRVVAELACQLGRDLKARGFNLNLNLLRSSGLLHDLVRHHPDHARTAAAILLEHGFPKVAEVVGSHIDCIFSTLETISEHELVYLADKLIQGSSRISLEDRFQNKLEAFKNEPQALSAVKKRLQRARLCKARIERALGKPVERVGGEGEE